MIVDSHWSIEHALERAHGDRGKGVAPDRRLP